MVSVLITGASGFVGRALTGALLDRGYAVRAALRSMAGGPLLTPDAVVVGEIDGRTDWSRALDNIEVVVHLAARVHVQVRDSRAQEAFRETNERGTAHLADVAARSGVSKFVFLSSIKVNGEDTSGRAAYNESDVPDPRDPYGVSKWLAEKRLREIAGRTGMGFSIVRSPLVYGPGVGANFLRLMRWVDAGIPLPFASVCNRRSLVSIWNLCDLLAYICANRMASGGTWMVSDDEDVSTPELIRRIGIAMQRRVRLVAVPISLLTTLGVLSGRREEVARLCGSLAVDIRVTRRELEWSPSCSLNSALAKTVEWYMVEGRSRAN